MVKLLLIKIIITNVPGIFAAGDVTDQKNKQIIISMGAGANAALNALTILSETKATVSIDSILHLLRCCYFYPDIKSCYDKLNIYNEMCDNA